MLKSLRYKPTTITLLLIFSTIILFTTGMWYFFLLVWQSKEQDLNKRLNAIAQILPYSFSASDIVLLSRGDENSTLYKDTLDVLKRQKEINTLRSITVLNYESGKLTIAVDGDEKYKIGDEMPLLLVDNEEIQSALKGNVIATPLYFINKIPYKRAYAPIYDDNGTVIGLIRIEANINYYNEMMLLKHRLIALSVITSFLLIIVAIILHKIMLRLVNAERAIAQADRLQSMGRLATGIAHEIRNPLGIIRASAENVMEDLDDAYKEVIPLMKDIIEEVDRINSLITQFLHLARLGPEESLSKSISPIDIAQSIVSLMENALKKEGKTISLHFDGDIPNINFNENSFKQILLNLILNAREATNEGGIINITIENKKNAIRILVNDNGCGIAQKDIKKIFEPFYTTKWSGTGLGLSITNNIIESAGGSISIESKEGLGTTVIAELKK